MSERDFAGTVVGRLTIIGPASEKTGGKRSWMCRCECGRTIAVATQTLTRSRKVPANCGCLTSEMTRERNTTHGMSKSPEFRAWRQMRKRCFNPNDPSYPRYGARGIVVCDEWVRSFETFLSHVGLRPSPKHSLDRIDNDRNYEPGNVRWATNDVQMHNTRSTVLNPVSVCLIRYMRRRGSRWSDIAWAFGYDDSAIRRVANGRSWSSAWEEMP